MRADEGRSHARIRAAGGCINDGNAVAAVQGPCHGRASLWPDRAGELTATLRSAPAVVLSARGVGRRSPGLLERKEID